MPLKLSKTALQQEKKRKARVGVAVFHGDVIRDEFWQRRSWILSGRAGKVRGEGNGGGRGRLEIASGLEGLMVESGDSGGNVVEYEAEGLM